VRAPKLDVLHVSPPLGKRQFSIRAAQVSIQTAIYVKGLRPIVQVCAYR
jgi:hypothetical protein